MADASLCCDGYVLRFKFTDYLVVGESLSGVESGFRY